MLDINALLVTHKPAKPTQLKRLILVFDSIYMLAPSENLNLIPDGVCNYTIRQNYIDKYSDVRHRSLDVRLPAYGLLYDGPNYETIDSRTIDEFDYARDKGVVRILDPMKSSFYHTNWLPLRVAYDFDTASEPLLNLSRRLLEAREGDSTGNGIVRGFMMSLPGTEVYPRIPEPAIRFTEEENRKFKYELQAFSAIGKLNRGLAIAGEMNLIPAFVDPQFSRMFIEKSEVARSNSDEGALDQFRKQEIVELNQSQYLLHRISERIIPDEILDTISVRELVLARNNTQDKLEKVRSQITSRTRQLASAKFDRNFSRDAELFIEKELDPLIRDYNNKFYEMLPGLLGYSGTVFGAVAGTMVGLMQGLNPLHVVALSGVSAAIGQKVSNLGHIITRKRERFRNGYAYFLDFLD